MKVTVDHLKKENEALLLRLTQAEEALDAIRNGEVDAIVINGSEGEKIFSLTSAETPYRIIIEKMNEGAVIISTAGMLMYSNQRFADMVDIPLEQLIGSSFLQFVDDSELPFYEILFHDGLEEGCLKEIQYQPDNENVKYFRLSFSPLPMDMVGDICIMVMDITALKENEKKIIYLNNHLELKVIERTAQYEAVNKELEAFSYSVSHDLRAPLRAVNSYAHILAEDYSEMLNEDAKQILGNIQFNTKKAGNLIDELLNFSRLGRKELDKKEIDMNALMHLIVQEFNETVPHSAQILISDLPPAMADYKLISHVISNLLSNAVKYSSKKPSPVIEIFAEKQEGEVVYVIKDNGAGFDMRFADKLFSVFQRLHSEQEFEGNGIGLAIAHRIIAKHGGKIWGTGKVDEGAIFSFTLH